MTQVSTSSQAAMSQQERSLLKRVAGASAIGTAAEYYDFFAYGTSALLFFGQLFFPSSDPLVSTLAAFATYAVGFLARPLGGIVFGHIGDKVGRKKALVITTSGGAYRLGSARADLNFLEPYLRGIFGFMGVTEVQFVTADNQNQGESTARQTRDQAEAALRELAETW